MFEGDDDPHPNENIDLVKRSVVPEADNGAYNDSLSEELNNRYLGLNVLLSQGGKL